MSKIIIVTCENSDFLRTEALSRAIEFEEVYSEKVGYGIVNGVLWKKYTNNSTTEWYIYVYQTKTAITVDVRMV